MSGFTDNFIMPYIYITFFSSLSFPSFSYNTKQGKSGTAEYKQKAELLFSFLSFFHHLQPVCFPPVKNMRKNKFYFFFLALRNVTRYVTFAVAKTRK